jgi:hypothetical protein
MVQSVRSGQTPRRRDGYHQERPALRLALRLFSSAFEFPNRHPNRFLWSNVFESLDRALELERILSLPRPASFPQRRASKLARTGLSAARLLIKLALKTI